MNHNVLFNRLDKKLGSQVQTRRYNLSDMISESYKSLYQCQEGSNLQRIAESHLSDVRNNPTDTERLSRNLSILKTLVNLMESGEIQDSDLLMTKSRKIRRGKRLTESAYANTYIDKGAGFVAPGDTITFEEIKDYWDEDHERDPEMSEFDSFDDWFQEVLEYLEPVKDDILESANSHPGWKFQEMTDDYEGPWEPNHYYKTEGALVYTITPPQDMPAGEEFDGWKWEIYDNDVATIIDERDGFSSFEEAEADLNSEISGNLGESAECDKKESIEGADDPEVAKDEILTVFSYGWKGTPWNQNNKNRDAESEIFNKYKIFNEDDVYDMDDNKALQMYKELKNISDKKESIEEADDPELTDEEIEELAKHLDSIRKGKKVTEDVDSTMDKKKKEPLVDKKCEDTVAPKKERVLMQEAKQEKIYTIITTRNSGRGSKTSETSGTLAELISNFKYTLETGKSYEKEKGNKKIDTNPKSIASLIKNLNNATNNAAANGYSGTSYSLKESRCYEGLKNFKTLSKDKAFMKTFKKLDKKLHEGTALTRQESINLYKAANSAMTQLTIELEKNPEFLETFRESTAILSNDVNSLLESMQRGKAPSKATMKSLAKFSEALLCESDDSYEGEYNGSKIKITAEGPAGRACYVNGRLYYMDGGPLEKVLSDLKLNIDHPERMMDESEEQDEELNDIEPPEEDFVGDEEGDIQSEEAEQFDQEYADARKEVLDDMTEKYEDSEDPEVQEKLAQEAEEVAVLTGEDPEEEEESDIEESEDDSDITDDELEELKKHLTEMRKSKKMKESSTPKRGTRCSIKK